MKKKKYMLISFISGFIFIGLGVIYYMHPEIIGAFFAAQGDIKNATVLDASNEQQVPDAQNVSLGAVSSTVSSPPAQKESSLVSKNKKSSSLKQNNNFIIPTTSIQVASSADVESSSLNAIKNNDTIIQHENDSSSSKVIPVTCSFPHNSSGADKRIIFNEIAWMGSPSSSNAEWIELKNISGKDIALAGWKLSNASEKIKIIFSDQDVIPSNGFFILSRGSADAGNISVSGGKIYSGSLSNGGDIIALVDSRCGVSDYIDASSGWPAGNKNTKQTLERDTDGVGWHASAIAGGTPAADNSAGPPPAQYKLIVAFQGDGPGSITSDPEGLVCGVSCSGMYASGTKISLTPVAGNNAVFKGWSGLCYGQITCSFVISGNISINADFRSVTIQPSSTVSVSDDGDILPTTSTTTSTSISTSTNVVSGTVLISAVQIAGSSSTNDMVKLSNAGSSNIDIGGWKLHKKSQSGTDYSLKQFPAGSTIAPGQTLIWANSSGGFSEMVGANISSTETLSADNSVALMDVGGTIIDAVAWGSGTNQYVEGSAYPTSPAANQMLVRVITNGSFIDTNNNASDFILQ